MNMSTGRMNGDLASFGAMNLGSLLPVAIVAPESSERLVNDTVLRILYQ